MDSLDKKYCAHGEWGKNRSPRRGLTIRRSAELTRELIEESLGGEVHRYELPCLEDCPQCGFDHGERPD